MHDEVLQTITINDMPNEYMRWIAEDCGLSVALNLIKTFGCGITLSIPRFECKDWASLRADQMPNYDMRLVARYCGLETAVALLRNYGHGQVYIPKVELSGWALKFVNQKYNGSNARELALKLGVSERFIYLCVSRGDRSVQEKSSPVRHEQLSLFGVGA